MSCTAMPPPRPSSPRSSIGARAGRAAHEHGADLRIWLARRRLAAAAAVRRADVPLTVFGVALAMERNPAVVDAFLQAGHEIASHGWRWINYQNVPEADERAHMARAVEIHRS